MKKRKNKKSGKKTVRKVKSAAKKLAKKTGSLIKKANAKGRKTLAAARKEWKREKPQREKYLRQAKEVGGRLNKIGNDVFEVIKKDLNK